ncbi:hypothetical protein CSPX01_00628 [Colletotrichum filicis]|nr:hypothetical protein CSPX01_00628 [Colletotrichum filicis]
MWKLWTSSVQLPPSPRVNWAKLDSPHPKTLNKELSDLYWSGIDRDLDEILRFLDMCENVPEPPTADSQPKHEDWLGFEAFAKRATRLAVNDALCFYEQQARTPLKGSITTLEPYLANTECLNAGMLDIDKTGHMASATSTTISKGGVLFTVRDRLQLHPVDTPTSSVTRCFALSKDRQLFKTERHIPRNRRVKAFMKQIVGSPFWSLREEDRDAEAEIIKDVAKASLDYIGALRIGKGSKHERKKSKARKKILEKLRTLLHERVELYIHSIVNKLFNKSLLLS